MGGDLASSCNDACTGSLAVGTNASAQAGVRLGSGIGFFVSGGFVLLRKSYDARPAALQPVGFGPNVGTVHEDIRFSGPTFAAGALYQRGEQVRYSARLGAGVLFASYRSGREYSLTTADVAGTASGSGTPYTARASDDGSLVVPYVQLEARVGFPLSPGFVFEVGLGGFAWLGLDGARWSGNSQAHAGSCPNANPQICQGLASSAAESLFGGLVIAGGPVLGLAGDL